MSPLTRPFGEVSNSQCACLASAGMTVLDLSCSSLVGDSRSVREETWLPRTSPFSGSSHLGRCPCRWPAHDDCRYRLRPAPSALHQLRSSRGGGSRRGRSTTKQRRDMEQPRCILVHQRCRGSSRLLQLVTPRQRSITHTAAYIQGRQLPHHFPRSRRLVLRRYLQASSNALFSRNEDDLHSGG